VRFGRRLAWRRQITRSPRQRLCTQIWQIDEVIAEGDKVVVRATNHCVQDSFLGVSAAGVEQVFAAMFIFQFADGLAVRTWRNAPDLQRLLQLGARIVPPA
jgi:predicted ester cyclase